MVCYNLHTPIVRFVWKRFYAASVRLLSDHHSRYRLCRFFNNLSLPLYWGAGGGSLYFCPFPQRSRPASHGCLRTVLDQPLLPGFGCHNLLLLQAGSEQPSRTYQRCPGVCLSQRFVRDGNPRTRLLASRSVRLWCPLRSGGKYRLVLPVFCDRLNPSFLSGVGLL